MTEQVADDTVRLNHNTVLNVQRTAIAKKKKKKKKRKRNISPIPGQKEILDEEQKPKLLNNIQVQNKNHEVENYETSKFSRAVHKTP